MVGGRVNCPGNINVMLASGMLDVVENEQVTRTDRRGARERKPENLNMYGTTAVLANKHTTRS
jgi:hypothetical protein